MLFEDIAGSTLIGGQKKVGFIDKNLYKTSLGTKLQSLVPSYLLYVFKLEFEMGLCCLDGTPVLKK